ncbi:MAG: phosphoribosylanthranilate isomerase [Betaproteobacteria bacterium]|nr:phosphoribosylanthranilate isomerase [Betaproteobacteria bacterium]
MKTRIKICCISSIEEAALAVSCGASALGLVSAMPSGPGVIEEDRIAEIIRSVPPAIGTFLLTSRQSADAIIDQQLRCRPNTVQLVDHVAEAELIKLRRALPGISLVQVIHVTGEESIAEAQAAAPHVDAILLDSGNQKLAVKELGGTGRVHDWSISRRIREACGKPLFLAGGLKPDNVRNAIEQVQPFGLDLCSGVRSDGHLDEMKLRAFFAAAQ